jgi:thiol-disulfide isomerase/thioredoxin
VTTSKTPTLLIVGGIVLVVLLVGAVALALSGGGSSATAEPATAAVRVQGTALPTYNKDAADPAVGQAVPTISGLGLDVTPMTIGPDDGALAIVVVAHWCPHCQAEIPVLSDWMAANELPDGIRVVTVSTGIDPARPNYPPSAWLEREGWTQPTLNDDASNSALAALGMASFPAFVFVNEDGTVAQRATGEIPIDQWEAALATITP